MRFDCDIAALCLVSPTLAYKQMRVVGTPHLPGAWGTEMPALVVSAKGKTPGRELAEKYARGLRLPVIAKDGADDKKFRKNSGWLQVEAAGAKGKPADVGAELFAGADHEATRAKIRGFLKARLAARKEAPWEGERETNADVKIAVRKAADDS